MEGAAYSQHQRADSVTKSELRGKMGNTQEKFRSLSVMKERMPQSDRGPYPISQTPMTKKDSESGNLPKIDYNPLLGNPLINQRGALKLRKLAKNAMVDFRESQNYYETKQKVEEEIDRYKMRQDLYSFRNLMRQQNHSMMEHHHAHHHHHHQHAHQLPMLKSPSVSLKSTDPTFGSPTPLFCRKYQKVMLHSTTKNSPRDGNSSTLNTHENHQLMMSPQDLFSHPSMKGLMDNESYKQETFNHAYYKWNQWNQRDESQVSAQKNKIRDRIQQMKEEQRIQKYQQELMSLQRKRRIIEHYHQEYNVKLPPNFNQQRCNTSQLHQKLATVYHRDRTYRAAVKIQSWFRQFQKRQLKSRQYWYMLRGVFKFKWFLRKFRDRMEKRIKDFDLLINTSATKIQKCFKGYLVRKQYGKLLAQKKIDRNYQYFYNIRTELLVSAQLLIAYVWRMNRIKIKLARKKREKEEAAKKKAMATKGKYGYSTTTNKNNNSKAGSSLVKKTTIAPPKAQASQNNVVLAAQPGQKTQAAVSTTAAKKPTGPITTPVLKTPVGPASGQQLSPQANAGVGKTVIKGTDIITPLASNLSQKTGDANTENESSQNENSTSNLKQEGALGLDGITGDIDEEKSDDGKSSADEDTSNANNNNADSAVTVGDGAIAAEANKSNGKISSIGQLLEATRRSTGSNPASLNNTGNKNDHN